MPPSPEKSSILLLVVGMLASGVCNTILNKYQDMQCVEFCDDPDPEKRRYFEQPVWQTVNMFIGEAAVWIVYVYQVIERRRQSMQPVPPSAPDHMYDARVVDDVDDQIAKDDQQHHHQELKGAKALLLWIPTLCDMTATTVMSAGLLFTSASVYQMLRGSVVIFTGIFSYFFLNRRLRPFEWVSLFMVVGGVSIVGLSSVLVPQNKPSSNAENDNDGSSSFDVLSLVGVFLILGAQLFTASQFVLEEKIMSRYRVTPLKAVGYEGSFGLFSTLAAMPILHVLFADKSVYFDLNVGFHDIFDVPAVWQTGIAIAISIAMFNWFGLSITSQVSATARSTIDACRTLFIWMVSLYLGWEQFSWIQVIGFVVMVIGTFYFNGVLRWPFPSDEEIQEGEREPLLRSPNTETTVRDD
ncbi:integral membrane protein [Lichtheimia corymbifera JMRC:FSU:9682]|uniref:Integral membrane protein n=1 Tax=Lichtheimia corymbifera JMRC:FSU:9682 TaxID=1263082 RepID=A0A068RR69_9FUNG|nr:integral membrane protein [Lichtheimia corymbifera JMRC:FSU:9682]